MPFAPEDHTPAADFSLAIDGAAVPVALALHTVGVTVEEDLELPSMFALHVVASEESDRLAWVDDSLFEVGHEVEIRMGYANQRLETLLVGEITGLEPEFQANRLPGLVVRGYDRRHRLTRGRKTRSFSQQKDSAIASLIAQDAGLTSEVEDTGVTHEYVLQANQTDFEFLQERARRINYELLVENKRLIFRRAAFDEGEAFKLSLDEGLIEFYPRLSAARQLSEVTLRGWSPKDKEKIVGRAQSGDEISKMGGARSGAALVSAAFGTTAGVFSQLPVQTPAEADQIAKAHFNERTLSLVEGEGVCAGNTQLRPGKVVRLEGLGSRFSGRYYITSAAHEYRAQHGYHTRFNVRRNAS